MTEVTADSFIFVSLIIVVSFHLHLVTFSIKPQRVDIFIYVGDLKDGFVFL